MGNPVISVHVSRGGIVESKHRIHAVILSSDGRQLHSWGDMQSPVYPRSAIKALQALAFMELGGAEHFQFTDEEIAIMCASHNGEEKHTATVQAMMTKLGMHLHDFECGHHWPMRVQAGYALARAGQTPNNLHNNCSGKHAGMLALAKLMNADNRHYINIDHPVQQKIAQTMAQMCECDFEQAPWSPDGCSAPTWAIPLPNLALGFAKFADPAGLADNRKQACQKLFQAVVDNPFMVAGTERYCTDMMGVLGSRVFLKVGAEGVYIAAIPDLKLAIALKCEDGAARGAESVMTALLDLVGATDHVDSKNLVPYRQVTLKNWNGLRTGDITCVLPE